MMHHRQLGLALALFMAAGAARAQEAEVPRDRNARAATLVVTNAEIVTLDSRYPRAEALAARGEWIVAIGSRADILKYVGEHTQVLDAGGHLVIPGFNDAHCHFAGGSSGLRRLNLYGIDSLAEVLRLVKEKVAAAQPGEWITGARYDHTLWGERWPTKGDLDRVAPDNPVKLTRASGHSAWVNSKALELAGITPETPDPHAGEIQRDPATGAATGILLESAAGLVRPRGAQLTPAAAEARRCDDLRAGFRHAARLGITSVQTSSSLSELERIRRLREKGELTLRWNGWLSARSLDGLIERGIRTGQGDHWVRVGFLKVFIDGTLGDGTAAMFTPFTDRPESRGLPTRTQAQLDELVVRADRHGLQVGIHAIGDQGTHMVLNAYEKAAEVNGTADMRHRIEHAQLIDPDDMRRFARLGVVASMQPTHCTTDMRFAERRVGRERCKTAYAWRSLLQSGAILAFGTDWSVEPLDPMRGVFSGVTRTNIQKMEPRTGWFPEQKLTVAETLYYYTWGSAYAEHLENVKGTLAPGRLADLVVVDRDLFVIPSEEILAARIDYTVVGGRIVWDRAADKWGPELD